MVELKIFSLLKLSLSNKRGEKMENLKNTITKTDTLKNNLKTVTNQIKQSIIRGGVQILKV